MEKEIKTKYIDRTDNKYLPNNVDDWHKFMWHLHFYGGRCILVAMHYDRLEKEWKRSNAGKKNN